MKHPVFQKILSNLQNAFDEEVENSIDNIVKVHFENIEVSVCFFDQTNFKPHKLDKVTDTKIENRDVTYDVTGLYKDEGFSAGYRSGEVTKDINELSFEIYENVLEVKKCLLENKEENVASQKRTEENAEECPEFNHAVEVWKSADSEEELDMLSGGNNGTTMN